MSFLSTAQDTSRYHCEYFNEIDSKKNVVYGQATTQGGVDQKLIMDIYMPKGDLNTERPLIIFAHGGYFIFGDKASFAEECEFFAKSGYVAVSINYRLIDIEVDSIMTPKIAVIDAVSDMKAAVRYFTKESNEYKIDSDNIFVGGYSAGAITSLHYAYANTTNDVLEMGGAELAQYVKMNGSLEGNSGNPGNSSKIKGVVNIAGSLHSAELVNKGEPALYSVHGTADLTVPFNSGLTGETLIETEGSGLIHKKAQKVGVTNLLRAIPDLDHSAFYFCDDCLIEMRSFLNRVGGL
ncbi:MAG: para-nitrobenzyl esterase [Arenicella sp.]|jgi:para-nitrobenzyl esterase